jgi:hypothetical protein
VIHIALVSHHLITYARECERGMQMASNYAAKPVPPRKAAVAATGR